MSTKLISISLGRVRYFIQIILCGCWVNVVVADSLMVRMHDGQGGLTCDYFDKALGIPWHNRGGDWSDANGEEQGPKSFASVRVPVTRASTKIEIDVTAPLVDGLASGRFAGFWISGAGGGEISIATREHSEISKHPVLEITDVAGRIIRLYPRADTYSNCTSNSSLGMRNSMHVGSGQAAVIDFDVNAALSKRVVKASLYLHPLHFYGNSALLSVYRLGGRAGELPRKVISGIAAISAEKDIYKHPDVLFFEDFERTDWVKRWSVLGKQSQVQRVSADPGFEPLQASALKVTIRRGTSLGLDLRYLFKEKLGYEPEDIYLRYYVRFSQEWQTPVDGGKLPGLSGTYGRAGWGGRKPDGYNGWSMRMHFLRQPLLGHPARDAVAIGFEPSIPAIPDGVLSWADGFAGVLDKERWYCIEQHVRLNTPGYADGLLEGWVDGKMAFKKSDVVYRHTRALKIEQVWMNVYHGGQVATPRDISMYIDNVVVARQYIGPFDRERQ